MNKIFRSDLGFAVAFVILTAISISGVVVFPFNKYPLCCIMCFLFAISDFFLAMDCFTRYMKQGGTKWK